MYAELKAQNLTVGENQQYRIVSLSFHRYLVASKGLYQNDKMIAIYLTRLRHSVLLA